jgi:hypothetical protein
LYRRKRSIRRQFYRAVSRRYGARKEPYVKQSILVVVLALAAVVAAVATPAAAPANAHLAVSQPVPQPLPQTIIGSKPPCFDFCSRALCVQGTTCGPNPKTGVCGCWPDDLFPTNPSTDPSSGV